MESGQIVEWVLMEQRLRNQWSYDERAWRIREAHWLARQARGPWWAALVPRRSQQRRQAVSTAAAPAGA